MAQVWCDTTLQGGGKPGPCPIRLSINRSWEGKRRPGDSVARGWGVVVLLQGLSEMNRYAGDHKGPPCPASSSLAPTDYPALCLTSRLRLMPIGRPSRVPWQSFTDSGLVDKILLANPRATASVPTPHPLIPRPYNDYEGSPAVSCQS